MNEMNEKITVELFEAIITNNLRTVKRLIKEGVNVNYVNKENITPLMAVCLKVMTPQSYDMLVELINAGADINYTNTEHKNALLLAIENGKELLVEYLLIRGANIKQTKIGNKAPKTLLLNKATSIGNIYIMKSLIKAGANVNEVDIFCEPPLYQAIVNNNLEAVKLLIKSGANIYQINRDGWDALILSAYFYGRDLINRNKIFNYILKIHKENCEREAKNYEVFTQLKQKRTFRNYKR